MNPRNTCVSKRRPALPRTASERAPPLALRENWQGRHIFSYPKPARGKRQVSPKSRKPPAKCGRCSWGEVSSTRPERSHSVRGASARATHTTLIGLPSRKRSCGKRSIGCHRLGGLSVASVVRLPATRLIALSRAEKCADLLIFSAPPTATSCLPPIDASARG
jgi:hypothetical protein